MELSAKIPRSSNGSRVFGGLESGSGFGSESFGDAGASGGAVTSDGESVSRHDAKLGLLLHLLRPCVGEAAGAVPHLDHAPFAGPP